MALLSIVIDLFSDLKDRRGIERLLCCIVFIGFGLSFLDPLVPCMLARLDSRGNLCGRSGLNLRSSLSGLSRVNLRSCERLAVGWRVRTHGLSRLLLDNGAHSSQVVVRHRLGTCC